MLNWFTNISILDYALLGIIACAFLYEFYFYIRYIAGVNRKIRRDKKKNIAQQTIEDNNLVQPGVSVIVCAHNEAANLNTYLLSLLEQKYPEFEVIVVDDGSEDITQEVLAQYAIRYSRLHLTFVPHEARVQSSKKLALTLAAKAAQYDYLLLTDADCRPESNLWISEMMKGFSNPETEIVLGFGAYFKESSLINRLISYDTLFNGLQYLGMAISNHPYMGVGRNLAYKKETFFNNKGFAGLLNHRAGDDDLFVNKIAHKNNTAVVCTKESITWSIAKHSFKEWNLQKSRHLSVAPSYKTATKLRIGIEPLMRGIFYAMLIVCGILGSPIIKIAAAAMFIIRLSWQIVIINMSAKNLGVRKHCFDILLWDIFLPLTNLFHLTLQAIFPARKNRW